MKPSVPFLFLISIPEVLSFLYQLPSRTKTHPKTFQLFMSAQSDQSTDEETMLPNPFDMRIKEIQAELKSMGVSYADCFDKDSICDKLKDARSGAIPTAAINNTPTESTDNTSSSTDPPKDEGDTKDSNTNSTPSNNAFDAEEYALSIRSLRVKELKTMLAERGIRWGTMKEKEEMVQALVSYQEKAADFSLSGKLTPGKVTDIDGESLGKELKPGAGTPLLLDVYAVWCGPCKMMAPELEEAAKSLGNKVRVAKIDSDKYPEWGSELNVGGLPSVIVFDESGKEVDRVEGALPRDKLIELAEKHTK